MVNYRTRRALRDHYQVRCLEAYLAEGLTDLEAYLAAESED